jgi:hypothetical protein
MKKGEEDKGKQGDDQEDVLTNSEFGFVFDFFISESKSDTVIKDANKDKPVIEGKSEFESKDQSVTFFLPDFFSRED